MGSKIYRDLRWLKHKVSRLNVEVKHYDADGGASTLSVISSASLVSLNAIAQGDTNTTRS
jgi:hypothetical protein